MGFALPFRERRATKFCFLQSFFHVIQNQLQTHIICVIQIVNSKSHMAYSLSPEKQTAVVRRMVPAYLVGKREPPINRPLDAVRAWIVSLARK